MEISKAGNGMEITTCCHVGTLDYVISCNADYCTALEMDDLFFGPLNRWVRMSID